MTRKVGVIGMGNVGSTVAHYIVAMGFADDLVLIDKNEAKVKADALDFEDAMANLPFHTNITVIEMEKIYHLSKKPGFIEGGSMNGQKSFTET